MALQVKGKAHGPTLPSVCAGGKTPLPNNCLIWKFLPLMAVTISWIMLLFQTSCWTGAASDAPDAGAGAGASAGAGAVGGADPPYQGGCGGAAPGRPLPMKVPNDGYCPGMVGGTQDCKLTDMSSSSKLGS